MPPTDPGQQRQQLDNVYAARSEARRAAHRLARDRGAEVITRPAWPGSQAGIQDVPPLEGARAARDLELGARSTARDYIRYAREAGSTWQQIGAALGVTPGGDADQEGDTVAEAAYTYAAGRPDPDAPWQPRTFHWHCQSCDKSIWDHGLADGPAEDEQGHAGDCFRLAEALAQKDAGWEAEL